MPIIKTSKTLAPRDPYDHYPTDQRIATAALILLKNITPWYGKNGDGVLVCDAGAGAGNWGNAAREVFQKSIITGVELRVVESNENYNWWIGRTNYANYKHPITEPLFDLHIGNPAYGDLFNEQEKARKKECEKLGKDFVKGTRPDNMPFFDAEQWVRKAIGETRHGGYVVFLLRQSFLEGVARARKFWKEYPPQYVLTLANRPSFMMNGKTDSDAYAIFYWRVGYFSHELFQGGWLDWKKESA